MFTRQEKPEDTRAAVPPEYSSCLGRVVVTDGGRMLFVPEDEPALKGCWYYVLESGFGQSDAIPEGLHSGDLVRVYWQYVREVYPPQMPVYRVELIERGRYQDISREARDAIASGEVIVREEETETAEPINSEAETEPTEPTVHEEGTEPTEPTAPEAETYPTEPEPIVREEGSMMTGRIWRAGDAVFFIPEDENGQLSMTEFCLLRDGASGVILLPGTLQTGDRVRVPRGAFLYSDPPILVLKRAPVLVEHGTVDSIDPAIRQQVTDRLSATRADGRQLTLAVPGGGCRGQPPTNPAFSLLSCPHPPTPLPGGKGEIFGFLMQGASPLASPGAERARHLQSLPCGHPAQGSLRFRRKTGRTPFLGAMPAAKERGDRGRGTSAFEMVLSPGAGIASAAGKSALRVRAGGYPSPPGTADIRRTEHSAQSPG